VGGTQDADEQRQRAAGLEAAVSAGAARLEETAADARSAEEEARRAGVALGDLRRELCEAGLADGATRARLLAALRGLAVADAGAVAAVLEALRGALEGCAADVPALFAALRDAQAAGGGGGGGGGGGVVAELTVLVRELDGYSLRDGRRALKLLHGDTPTVEVDDLAELLSALRSGPLASGPRPATQAALLLRACGSAEEVHTLRAELGEVRARAEELAAAATTARAEVGEARSLEHRLDAARAEAARATERMVQLQELMRGMVPRAEAEAVRAESERLAVELAAQAAAAAASMAPRAQVEAARAEAEAARAEAERLRRAVDGMAPRARLDAAQVLLKTRFSLVLDWLLWIP
jgi:hypothetical protein